MILRGKNERFKEGQKMDNFQNGRSIDFVQKSKLVLFVYFTETMPEKIVFRYFG